MDKLIIPMAAVCVLLSGFAVLLNHLRMKKTFDRIDQMLDDATENRFTEKLFDESPLSALENRFANYLSASATSSRKLTLEHDKIKSLISDISHQTKTPIANLLLYSELLSERELPEAVRSDVESIHQQAENLRFLIDSLIKLSRLENGILTLSPHREPLQPMLRFVQDQFLSKASEKGLELCLADTDASAIFDPKWTAEALANLVDNAIKYTAEGKVTLSVFLYEMFARIDVSDTGAGIPGEELPKIFSRFYRSENALDQDGMGIGLYLAREIVTAENGYIKVTSSPGKGSVFSIYLPR